MIEDNPNNVLAAFEILLGEVKAEIDFLEKLGTRAFERHDHDAARKAAEHAVKIMAFRDKVVSLRKEWETLAISHDDSEEEASGTQRRKLGRLPRGIGTPQSAYRQPILQALNEMDGSARTSDVLTRVEQLMRKSLKKEDYEPLPADGMLRWSKSAQWERNSMVKEGLMKSHSPHGVWEISGEVGGQCVAFAGTFLTTPSRTGHAPFRCIRLSG